MKKRMVVMLAAVLVFIDGDRGREVQADPDGDRAGVVVPAAARRPSPPWWPSRSAGRRRSARSARSQAVHGVTVSADLPGIVDNISLRLGPHGPGGRGAGPARHAPGAARSWRPREAQRDLARLNLDRMRRPAGRKGSSRRPTTTAPRPSSKQAEARVGEIRATIDRKTIRAPVHRAAGHPPGEPRAVPAGRHRRSCRCSRSTRST